ncbi:hypothetical protein PHISCL_07782 [Aspergillus sclerotialis]|uniref:Uncharacterized protein n=1 Tax=Aspergillus sclerotialis TaxID=2070753 RepID=A0A3A2ZS67_9EURO|nr:hypothetical protein PHISCL_07782 [Aspergillus sclerotialis]
MGEPGFGKDSWESSSSAFSTFETSASQDSCYGSDETSVTSILSSTAPTSTVPSFASSPKTTLRPVLKPTLKSILKKECVSLPDDTESASGYDSDAEYEHSFFEENDDEDLYSSSGEDTDDMAEVPSDDESFDDSFIAFESMVRFDPEIQFIEAPEYTEDESPETETTFHELIERAQAFGHSLLEGGIPEYTNAGGATMGEPEEYTRDAMDLDKNLFAAYMNGIRGIADSNYTSQLRAHIDDIKSGRAETPFFDSDNAHGIYLDNVLNHVMGSFRNLVTKEELDELLVLIDKKIALQRQNEPPHEELEICNKTLLDKVASFLSERLGDGNVEIGPDELAFFTNGVAHSLGNVDTKAN